MTQIDGKIRSEKSDQKMNKIKKQEKTENYKDIIKYLLLNKEKKNKLFK